MTYRGIVRGGVVVLEGELRPADGTPVEVTPLESKPDSLSSLPAFGIWRDRNDMADSEEATRRLRERSERRSDR
jgi:hypothetical protein